MKLLKIFFAAALALASVSVFAADDLSKLDKNFAVEKFDGLKVVYRDALEQPFVLEGFPWYEKGKPLYRLPADTKPKDISGGVWYLAKHTSGGVVRFRTDSPYIVVKASILSPDRIMGLMPATGSSGFDLYANKDTYVKSANPMRNITKIPDPFTQILYNGKRQMRDYTLYLPLYNGVNSLEIGTSPDAKFETPAPHKIKKPIVFYGSSITQGAAATRTSTNYCALLARKFDAPLVNLGFSGNAKGETKMAELIASLDMSAFIYDYDHNAPNAAHLKKTHEPFFKIIRAAHPKLPVVMISRFYGATDERTNAIKQTYLNAVKSGDKNVYFIDGRDLVKEVDPSYLTVDGTHPNDLGFYLMFKNTLPVLKEAMTVK